MATNQDFEVKKEVLDDGTEVVTMVPKIKKPSEKETSSTNNQ